MKNGTDMNCSMYLYRQIGGSGGYSQVAGKMIQSLDTGTNTWSNAIFKLQYLDSPNTTSQITYQVTITTIEACTYCVNRSENDSNNNDHCRNVSSITVMEVSA